MTRMGECGMFAQGNSQTHFGSYIRLANPKYAVDFDQISDLVGPIWTHYPPKDRLVGWGPSLFRNKARKGGRVQYTLLLGARTLLGAPGLTTRSKRTLLGAKGIATRSKDATRGSVSTRWASHVLRGDRGNTWKHPSPGSPSPEKRGLFYAAKGAKASNALLRPGEDRGRTSTRLDKDPCGSV